MPRNVFYLTPTTFVACLVWLAPSPGARAQIDVAKTYKTNCVLCHAADGSGNTASGRALKAKDLASSEVQQKSDAELTGIIVKGKGKMPAFGAKLKAEDVKQVVAYIRAMPKK